MVASNCARLRNARSYCYHIYALLHKCGIHKKILHKHGFFQMIAHYWHSKLNILSSTTSHKSSVFSSALNIKSPDKKRRFLSSPLSWVMSAESSTRLRAPNFSFILDSFSVFDIMMKPQAIPNANSICSICCLYIAESLMHTVGKVMLSNYSGTS